MKKRKTEKHGISIGLNSVNEQHYSGGKTLSKALNSMDYFHNYFKKKFRIKKENLVCLSDTSNEKKKRATASNFINHMDELSKKLDQGDSLAIYFCGHGYRLDEKLKKRESLLDEEGWCFYDRVLFFVELWELARRFRAGVKIVIFVDSCYGGGATDLDYRKELNYEGEDYGSSNFIVENEEIYWPILKRKSRPMHFQVPPSILFITSSSETSKMHECYSDSVSVFTHIFKKVISDIKGEDLNFQEFYELLQRGLFQNTICNQATLQHPRWHYYQGHQHTKLIKNRHFSNL